MLAPHKASTLLCEAYSMLVFYPQIGNTTAPGSLYAHSTKYLHAACGAEYSIKGCQVLEVQIHPQHIKVDYN